MCPFLSIWKRMLTQLNIHIHYILSNTAIHPWVESNLKYSPFGALKICKFLWTPEAIHRELYFCTQAVHSASAIHTYQEFESQSALWPSTTRCRGLSNRRNMKNRHNQTSTAGFQYAIDKVPAFSRNMICCSQYKLGHKKLLSGCFFTILFLIFLRDLYVHHWKNYDYESLFSSKKQKQNSNSRSH